MLAPVRAPWLVVFAAVGLVGCVGIATSTNPPPDAGTDDAGTLTGGGTQSGGGTAQTGGGGGSMGGGGGGGGDAGVTDSGVPWVTPRDGGAWGIPDGGIPQTIAANTWVRVGDCPGDAEGREVPPGRASTWVYEPASKRFLRYGGYTPRFSNALDSYDPTTGTWERLFAEDETYPTTRPGGGSNWGLHFDRVRKRVWFSGGLANLTTGNHGLWSYDPATRQFTQVEATLPEYVARLTYDSVHDVFVASPAEGYGAPLQTRVYDVATKQWSVKRTATAPQATWSGHYAGVFHEALAKVVIFAPEPAGLAAWAFDVPTAQWEKLQTNQGPSTRTVVSIAYDPELQIILLQGVSSTGSDTGSLNDTWVFNLANGEWREVATPGPTQLTSASGRIETTYRQALSYDADRHRFLLADPDLGVWAFRYDASQPPGPAAISGGFVPVIGAAAQNPPAPGPGEVRRHFPTPVNPAIAALGANQMVRLSADRAPGGEVGWWYDSDQGVMVKYGGCGNASSPYWTGYGNSLIIFDPGTGTYLTRRVGDVSGGMRPGNGCTRSVVYDPARKVSWFFGGVGSGPYSQQPPNAPPGLFTYDFVTDRFGKVGTSTEPSVSCNAAFGPSLGLAVYPDQIMQGGQLVKRTWIFESSTATWTAQVDATSPGQPYAYQRMTWDSSRERFIALAASGDPDAGQVNVTLAYEPANHRWVDLHAQNQPPFRASKFGLVYDSKNDVVILMGGSVSWNTTYRNDVWAYSATTNRWEQQHPVDADGGSPPELTDSMQAGYDPRSNAIIFAEGNWPWAYRYAP